ncbi:PREDICTED: spindle and kinetochore-associated protein 3 isoform X1 [Myotis davidii]|uniref:spindle and kinetochore-associated protein 3 isoform X1 n=1 Tax=Myotis davidii TaxID=225400 RepID=UPI000767891E|nr:PREDICTED: spindle and kinetochore-associated protein 3 isoform X1 [Myotis davidii]
MAPARLRLPREVTSAPATGPTKLPAPGIQASGGARGAVCSPWTRSGASVRSCGPWRSPWTAKRRGCSGRWRRKTAVRGADFEGYAVRILHDLNSEVRTLKDNVNILLDKASLESQESIGFIKATKVLMKKTSVDIIKIRELFQKYGYNPRAKKNSAVEQEAIDSKPESTRDENLQKPDVKDDMSNPVVPSSSVSEKIPCSPQLSDFGLERYLISQIPPNPPQAVNNHKKEPNMLTPSSSQSPVEVLKTPKCALNMDDFECVTPKLEHFGISEYTVCLNEDYTMGLKNVKNKSEEAVETEPVSSNSTTASLINQQLEKNDDEYTKSPLAPTFCTPGLKIPSTKNGTALVSTDYPLSKTNSSSNDLEMKDYTLVLNSDKCFESCAEASSSPVISSYENLLRTPTPPKVTTIPEDILQILSKYNPNLATTPVAVKACHPAKHSLLDVKDGTSEMLATRKLVKKS